jgi:hypothetical protein
VLNYQELLQKQAMNIQAAKLDIVQKILAVKTESIIEKINKILDKEMIVGYTVEGKPLTKKAYNKRLQKAEEQIRSGNYVTQEEIEKESENW